MAFFLACIPSIALTDVLEVPAQFPTIQSAIDAAANGDEIHISPGVYVEQLVIDGKTISLLGKTASDTIIDGDDSGTVIDVYAGADSITLANLTVRNGFHSQGAGLRIRDRADIYVDACHFLGNRSQNADAIEASDGLSKNFYIRNSLFSSNGLCCEINGSGVINIRGSFGGNYFINNTITDNVSGGGAMVDLSGSNVVIEGNVFANNIGESGSTLLFRGSNSTVNDNVFFYNRAFVGGAYNNAGSRNAFVANVAFANSVVNHGGGIHNGRSDLRVTDSLFLMNSAVNVGGAIFQLRPSHVENNVFAMNTAEIGGGVSSSFSSGSLANNAFHQNLFVGNSATVRGGGLDMRSGRTIHLSPPITSNTFANNSAPIGAQIYFLNPGNLVDFEFSNNSMSGGIGDGAISCILSDFAATAVTRNNNTFGDSIADYAGTCADLNGVNGNISSPTQFSSLSVLPALSDSSPLIDAGTNGSLALTISDIDGKTRIVDGNSSGSANVDIGAGEYQLNGTLKFRQLLYQFQERGPLGAIQICRTGGTIGGIAKRVRSGLGTAIENRDLHRIDEVIIFADGESGCKNIDVHMVDNTKREKTKALIVEIVPDEGSPAPGQRAVIEILDDESFYPSTLIAPVIPGAHYEYLVNGVTTGTTDILPGPISINGSMSYQARDETGDIEYLSNDGNGLRDHGSLNSSGGFVTPTPPVVLISPDPFIGEEIESSGILAFGNSGVTVTYGYSAKSEIISRKIRSFPHGIGNREAWKIKTTLRVSGTANGTPDGLRLDLTTEQLNWLVPGIGSVRSEITTSDAIGDTTGVKVEELTEFNAADNDNDGLNNFEETTLGSNPNVSDSDGDGLSDNDEYRIYGTSLSLADSDRDGINDFDEEIVHGTSASIPDTDGDWLTDGDEISIYATNPLVTDSDGDGLIDGIEIDEGTDPNDPHSPAPVSPNQIPIPTWAYIFLFAFLLFRSLGKARADDV